MSRPAPCSAGPVFVTERSAPALTVVVVVAELFPGTLSVVPLDIVAVLLIVVPFGVFAVTLTTSLNVAVAPALNIEVVQLIVPVPRTGGGEQLKTGPLVCANETNVVFVGVASVNEALTA